MDKSQPPGQPAAETPGESSEEPSELELKGWYGTRRQLFGDALKTAAAMAGLKVAGDEVRRELTPESWTDEQCLEWFTGIERAMQASQRPAERLAILRQLSSPYVFKDYRRVKSFREEIESGADSIEDLIEKVAHWKLQISTPPTNIELDEPYYRRLTRVYQLAKPRRLAALALPATREATETNRLEGELYLKWLTEAIEIPFIYQYQQNPSRQYPAVGTGFEYHPFPIEQWEDALLDLDPELFDRVHRDLIALRRSKSIPGNGTDMLDQLNDLDTLLGAAQVRRTSSQP